MTIHTVVSVFDRAAQAYGRPFTVPSKGMAIRSFDDEVNREGSDMGKHPADYELYELGFFDDQEGKFVTFTSGSPELILRAEDVLKPR